MSTSGLNMSRRIRRTPFTNKVEECGVTGFSVVNHMLLPKAFQPTLEEDYWHLRAHVQIWDVSCQRQVQIAGPDAAALVQLMTPRNIARAKIGDCFYIPIIDAQGGMINDPVMLKLAEDRFWLSIADSDVLLYAMGLALGRGLDVAVSEPDVSPLQLQGPKSGLIMQALFGDSISDLKYYWLRELELEGIPLLVSRTGWSSELGYELYLRAGSKGDQLWELIMAAGAPHGLKPGHTS